VEEAFTKYAKLGKSEIGMFWGLHLELVPSVEFGNVTGGVTCGPVRSRQQNKKRAYVETKCDCETSPALLRRSLLQPPAMRWAQTLAWPNLLGILSIVVVTVADE
jgi:hypothetical protein